MEEKYLSIITNFGCHYQCPYCVVKNNGIQVPKTTREGLKGLGKAIKETGANTISISGGGDPLYDFPDNIEQAYWYVDLFGTTKHYNIPLEMHTSYMTEGTMFDMSEFKRVVYHANSFYDMLRIHRVGNEIVRVVYVVTEDFTEDMINQIAEYVKQSDDIDELSFRQLIGENYEIKYYCHDYLKAGHQKDWWYIEQSDYNTYYVEGKIYHRYEDIGKETQYD